MRQAKQTPTFLSAISTILLGILITVLSAVVTVFINYFAFFSLGLGLIILYVGYFVQWKQFQKSLPEDDDTGESGDAYNAEYTFGKETLAEKRP